MMKEGGKATLVVPPELAYGDAGSGGAVPPGATLKFESERGSGTQMSVSWPVRQD